MLEGNGWHWVEEAYCTGLYEDLGVVFCSKEVGWLVSASFKMQFEREMESRSEEGLILSSNRCLGERDFSLKQLQRICIVNGLLLLCCHGRGNGRKWVDETHAAHGCVAIRFRILFEVSWLNSLHHAVLMFSSKKVSTRGNFSIGKELAF